MCGINGIFSFHADAPPFDVDELMRTREAMRMRGPDAAGTWLSPDLRVGLGHRRLSIIDVSDRANQPMVSREGDIVLTFNGEIYNYNELRTGETFETTSDTEVLLRMYRQWGEAMLSWVRGMFAFAIWDARRNRLFLARDPYGIKPLYYANDGRTFRFASQVKALLAGGGVSRIARSGGDRGISAARSCAGAVHDVRGHPRSCRREARWWSRVMAFPNRARIFRSPRCCAMR